MPNHEHDGRADFDFLIGRWNVHNRRLRERLVGSTDWEEFEGTSVVCKVLGGAGNMDEVTFDRESGPQRGLTLRLYNLQAHEWSIYWATPITSNLFPPMIGQFENGRGEFYAHETHAGKHIYSRFIWTTVNKDACRWEQAFSPDGGRTWETNWTADFTRR